VEALIPPAGAQRSLLEEWAMLVRRRDCEGEERTIKETKQGGRDADRIEDFVLDADDGGGAMCEN